MNDPPSDGNESVIDIFVLSVSETVVPLFTEHLEKKGYRVTLFTDGSYLLETLRTGKPNLLICDTTTLDEEGFEVCRQIKADDDFWVIPVLILTSASTLTDLLHVLDCNADNFIPHPFDLSYSLSIIESMLGTPVERQTPDQIKTQFKISHDDRIYVVAANRRKLLEFLLSSFEIAVNKSSELSHVKTELQTLSESAIHLEDRVTEQTRVIDTIKATLHQKEQKISTLTYEVEEKKRLLAQKTDEIEQLAEKLDHHKALIVTYDGNIRTLIQEKKDIETSYCSEIDTLRQQISELSNEVDITKTSLDTVQGDLEEEKIHCTSLECTLELLVQQKELAEKSLRSITNEHEQLISAFEAEKNRATSAEQELKTVMQEKTQSEQELNLIITGLNETKQQQAADLIRLKDELETEVNRRLSTENQLGSLQQDKEQLESSLQSLSGEHEQLKSALEAEKNQATSAEQELKTVMQEKTQSEQELNLIITGLNETKQQQAADLTRLKGELETEVNRRLSTENQLGSLQQDKEQLESSLRSTITALKEHLDELQVQLETTRAALQNEENTTKSLKEDLAEVVAENEKTEVRVKEDLESYKTTFIRLKRDLDEATAIPKTLERDLDAAKIQNNSLVGELKLANQRRTQSDQQARLLADELEKVKTALDTERSLHQAGDKSIEALMQTMRRMEQDLRTSVEERDKLNETLENERRLRLTAEEKSKAAAQEQEHLEQELRTVTDERVSQENDRALKIQNLEKEFELVCNLQKSLEEQVNILTKEKLQAEQNVKVLTDELDQARNALADEWVDHMESDESSAAVGDEPPPRKQSFSPEEAAGIKKEKGQEIIAIESDFPANIESSSHALAMVTTPDTQKSPVSENELISHEPSPGIPEMSSEAVTDIVKTFCDEDLFEEAESTVTKADFVPKPSDVTESVPEKTGEELEEEAGEEPEKDSTGKIPDESGGSIPPVVFSFNRKQWFDLLKWAHHSTTLSHDQRLQIVRMGRLIQKDRKLTRKQEEQVKEMIALVQVLGYRPS
jgi:DNA-binding response OmpR family regulator